MTTLEIELAVSRFFDERRHLMVPNVSWGLGLHECDMLIVTKNGYANEVEIKINRYDLRADGKKRHQHKSNLIKRLFFAIPAELLEFQGYIPERAGVLVANGTGWVRLIRPAQINKQAKPLNPEQILCLGRLASMRIWSLKETLANKKNNNEEIIII